MEARKQYFFDKEKDMIKEIIDFVRNNEIKKDNENYFKLKQLMNLLLDFDVSFYNDKDNVELVFERVNSSYLGNYKDNTRYNYITDEVIKMPDKITLNEANIHYSELFSSDEDIRVSAIIKIIRVLFHEITHYTQVNNIRNNKISLRTLKFAKEYMAISLMERRENYIVNHDKYMIESDANLRSILKVNKFRIRKSSSTIKYVSMYSSSYLQIRDKSGSKVKEVDRDEYINELIDTTLKGSKKLYYLKKYPILQKEYNLDGNKIPLEELIKNYLNQFNITNDDNIKKMYFDIILRSLCENKYNITSDKEYEMLLEMMDDILLQKTICLLLSKKEYEYKNKFDDNLNYMPLNNKTIKYYIFNAIYAYNIEDAKKIFDLKLIYENNNLTEEEKNKSIEFLNNYFFKRLPLSGIFILKNGNKINIFDFYKEYIIPNIKSLYNSSLNDYILFLKEYVESDTYTMHVLDKERINKKYEKYEKVINNYIDDYNKERNIK